MIEEELPGRPLSDPAGRNGVTEVLPPGQRAAEQTQRLPRAGGALQDAVDLLNGGSNEVTGKQGEALQSARPTETRPAARQWDSSVQAEPTRRAKGLRNGWQRDTLPPSPESQRLWVNSAPDRERGAQPYSKLSSISQPTAS